MEYYSKTTTINVLLLIVSLITSIALIPCSAETNNNNTTLCIETEKQALLAFKKSLEDPNHLLSSWNDSDNRDCCAWEYVVCDHLTGHVREINLRSRNYDSGLGGMISPSMLNLKHLAYLDLSSNNFSGQEIPSFIGSMASLDYLNLSYNQFQGIPYNFRNLSSLRTLDLSGLLGEMDNIESLSGLVSLEYLGLDRLNLSRASSWLEVVNELPNLIELHLSACSLDRFPPDPIRLNFTSLEVLDLSFNDFDSPVPSWIFNLSNLVSLDFHSSNLRGPIPSDKNMGRLRFLDLSSNNFNCTLPHWLFNSYSLEHVDLSSSAFYGAVPNTVGNLSSLRILDLSYNEFSGKIMWRIGNICSLQTLDISFNEFEGNFSDVFGSRMSECFLASLLELDAKFNSLSGELTEQVGEFQRLRVLNLAYNSFTGSIPFGLGNVSSLTELELNNNKFVGNIPPSLGLLLNLSGLDLANNKLVGNIPPSLGLLLNLSNLYLSNNKLVGNIPLSLGQLSNLENLFLDHNVLEGIVTEDHFSNLSKLIYLSASENSLTLSVGEDWNPPFQLGYMDLGSWILGSQFPSWVQTQTRLTTVSLANTGISGEIPTWFWSLPSLTTFNLSHNNLSGELPHLISVSYVFLSSNNLSGPLPLISGFTNSLDLSNNSFSGGIARTLCTANQNRLLFLHLGGNDLSGEIPDCWMNWPSLIVLNLGNNNFIGKIPASFGLLDSLISLNLYNNSLSGKVPSSLQNCAELIKIDLSGNKLEGINITNPPPKLRFLILRSNYFSGQIAPEICTMRYLQVLDVAHNSFSGGIPTCLDNLTFTSSQNEPAKFILYYGSFIESASLTTKGNELQYDTVLPLFSIIDLSSNRLSGSIPEELTSLAGLRSLNLSGNYLSGSIPDNIGDMASLESLDLSGNNISGEIPIGLARLTALGYLDLSYNDLSGRIPTSTQLQSFSPSSFIGNKLCGLPLSDKCDENNNNSPPPEKNVEASDSWFEELIDMWFYVCCGFGFIAGFLVWWLALIFKVSWRHAYFELLDDLWNRVCVCVS